MCLISLFALAVDMEMLPRTLFKEGRAPKLQGTSHCQLHQGLLQLQREALHKVMPFPGQLILGDCTRLE